MHNLIVGISNSGKSNLAKSICAMKKKLDNVCVIYDPTKSSGWRSSCKFSSPEKFLNYIDSVNSANVFIDEAKSLWDYDQKLADKLLYRGRHRGLLVFLICQRGKGMIPPNARNMCSRVFAFKQNYADAKDLAESFSDILLTASSLKIGEYVYSNGFDEYSGFLDYKNYPPEIILNKT